MIGATGLQLALLAAVVATVTAQYGRVCISGTTMPTCDGPGSSLSYTLCNDDTDLDLACMDVSGTTVTRRVIYNQGLNCPATWKANTAVSDCTAAFDKYFFSWVNWPVMMRINGTGNRCAYAPSTNDGTQVTLRACNITWQSQIFMLTAAPNERFLRLQKGAKCVAWRSGGDRLELAACAAGGPGNEQQFAALTYTGSAAPWMQLVATQYGDWDPFAASCVMEVGGVLRVLPCEEATQATSTFALSPAPIKLRPNSATASCLGLPGTTLSAAPGQPLQQLACANSQTQALVPVPVLTSTGGFSGYYRLQTLLGLCLRAPNANTGAMLTTVACSNTDTAMQFYFNPYGPKFRFRIRSRLSGNRCLDVPYGTTTNGANIILADCATGSTFLARQQFTVLPALW